MLDLPLGLPDLLFYCRKPDTELVMSIDYSDIQIYELHTLHEYVQLLHIRLPSPRS